MSIYILNLTKRNGSFMFCEKAFTQVKSDLIDLISCSQPFKDNKNNRKNKKYGGNNSTVTNPIGLSIKYK